MSSDIRNNHDRSGENLAADSLTDETERDLLIALSQVFSQVKQWTDEFDSDEIHYDHQVLLDYLISKDTGSSCAEIPLEPKHQVIDVMDLFLVKLYADLTSLTLAVLTRIIAARSIRIVCNSWRSFIEFPGVEEGLDQLCPKRQRVLVDSTDLNDGRISSLEQCNEGRAHGKKGRRNYRLPFVAARDCLVSLRTSINSLNQKNLFPYNPQVLLRRHFCGDLSSYSHGRTTLSCLISEQRLARHAICVLRVTSVYNEDKEA
ncbi:UNVERIFIED_CONTAM: hypothetical protein Scaly_2124300 [Sesamum calycinum]|uniref:Protein Lines C-terminal domain-containing protein n=1 Tax=Sesamum calycinum TaxID=2727403 RepID=A0AAW2MNU7_9LAMI